MELKLNPVLKKEIEDFISSVKKSPKSPLTFRLFAIRPPESAPLKSPTLFSWPEETDIEKIFLEKEWPVEVDLFEITSDELPENYEFALKCLMKELTKHGAIFSFYLVDDKIGEASDIFKLPAIKNMYGFCVKGQGPILALSSDLRQSKYWEDLLAKTQKTVCTCYPKLKEVTAGK